MRNSKVTLGAIVALMMGVAASAQEYQISWFTIDSGGMMNANGGNLNLGGTLGQCDAGSPENPMIGGAFEMVGGFWAGANGDAACTGGENIKSASCKDKNGNRNLIVKLANGREGDTFTVSLTSGESKSGTVNRKGKGKAKFANRPAGDTGTATAAWGCGATDRRDYSCP